MNVLLLPETKTATEVAELLVQWSATGLLRPFCVWTAGSALGGEARYVCDGIVAEEHLGRVLADIAPEEIEFVTFYPQAQGEAPLAGFGEDVERFLEHARERLLDRFPERTTTCTMVAAPESLDERLPDGLFRATWPNLLVAPEDRCAPGRVNQLEVDGDRFVPHAAHAAATIAELWSTPGPNRPDLLGLLREEPAGPLQVPVRVVRCYSRVIELGFVPDHVAALAFESRGGWPRPGKRFERPPDPERVLAEVAEAYLQEHRATLARRPFKPIRDEPPATTDLFEAFGKLLDQLAAFIRDLPSRLLEEARLMVRERAAAYIEAISGSTGRIAVRHWRESATEGEELESLNQVLKKEPLVIEDGAVERTWDELGKTTLGLVDGSQLPEAMQPWVRASGARQKVVCDPALLARDPEMGDLSPDEDGEDERPTPFLQRIRTQVQAAYEEAQARLAALEVPEQEDDSEEEEADDAHTGFLRRRGWPWLRGVVRRIAGLGLLAITATVVAWQALPAAAAAVAMVAIGLLLFLGIGFAARRALRRPTIPYDEQAAAELRELNRLLELAQVRGDVERLARRCGELDTWIAILSELLHRPWVREPAESLEFVATIDEESLPSACAVAVAENDRALLERFSRKAREKAFHPGWLTDIYGRVHALVLEDRPEAVAGGSVRSAAADTNQDEESLRRALLEVVLRGDGRRRRENPVATDLLKAIDASPIGELAPTVLPASAKSRPLGPTATWIAPPAGAAAVAGSREGQVAGVRGWKATGVFVAPDLVLTAAAVVVERLMFVSSPAGHPVEVVEVMLPEGTGLALLRLSEPCGEAVGAFSTAHPGAGVVALEAGAAGVAWRWGFVTESQRFGVIYDGGPPGLGAPVFDLSGRLVALQGEREDLLPVPAVEELLEMESSEPSTGNRTHGEEVSPVAGLEFLRSILERKGREFVSAYWSRRTAARAVELSLPPGLAKIEEGESVGRLSGGAEFLRPLRVMVHRLEASHSVEADELTATAPRSSSSSPGAPSKAHH